MNAGSFSSLVVRLAAELLIVVVGILLALAAGGWWEDRQDRMEELQVLTSIQEDIAASRALLNITVERVEADLVKLKILSEGNYGEAAQSDAAQLAELLHSLWDVPPVNVQMSAYNEIQNSGRLRLIEDPEVRILLAQYDQDFEFLTLSHLDAFLNQHTKLDPYLLAHVQMAQLARYALARDAGSDPRLVEPLPPLQDHHMLLGEPVFQNQVSAKFFLLTYYQAQTRGLLEVLSRLDAAIKKRVIEIHGKPVQADN